LDAIELPEAPPKRRRPTGPLILGAIGMALAIVFGLIAVNVSRERPTGQRVPGRTGTWVPGPAEEWAPGHYAGPSVSFDYPNGWHEFYLSAGWQYFAAYGPVSGGDVDYVAVFPAPPETKKITTLEDFVKWNGVTEDVDATTAQTVDVNGLTGYKMPIARTGPSGQDLVAWSILVKGERSDYLIACQYEYSTPAETQVSVGCERVMDTLVEVPPAVIADPSDCTDTELALLSSVPMPQGADPTEPEGAIEEGTEEGRHYCDLMVFLPSGYDGDVVGFFRPRMTEAGWDSEEAKMVRTFESYDVWRIFAIRDWDSYMVEVYVEDGHAHHFFITVVDG
jgi:hypothetical protein